MITKYDFLLQAATDHEGYSHRGILYIPILRTRIGND